MINIYRPERSLVAVVCPEALAVGRKPRRNNLIFGGREKYIAILGISCRRLAILYIPHWAPPVDLLQLGQSSFLHGERLVIESGLIFLLPTTYMSL